MHSIQSVLNANAGIGRGKARQFEPHPEFTKIYLACRNPAEIKPNLSTPTDQDHAFAAIQRFT